jgi:integrase
MMNDPVEDWLNSVAYSHSQSKATEDQYKRVWERFSTDIGMTAQEIIADYERSDDRNVMRKHARLIRSWIGKLMKEGLANTSIKVMVGAVKSFYKYNDLPLGHIPQAMSGTVYHNRDITKEEILQIMAVVKLREKAFFAVMAQSGLRPHTINQLRLKHLEDLERTPCKIEIPKELAKGKYGSYVTFIGPDAVKYLKLYFATRENLTPDSLLFCAHNDSTKPVNTKDMSRAFRLAARKLEKSGAINYQIREGKPSELRLYNLRKFFRKYANQMGFENVNYLMGHTVRGSDANYKPQNPEFYRTLYADKAMPFLRLEEPTPTETEQLRQQHKKEMKDLQRAIAERDNRIKQLEYEDASSDVSTRRKNGSAQTA